jgi:S-DNA-T family DNA segregation ATPase FtsK/SpoIIIE
MEERDPFFEQAARICVTAQQGSVSLLRRKFGIGFNRANWIIDQLEAAGIVAPFNGSTPREVFIKDEISLDNIIKQKSPTS